MIGLQAKLTLSLTVQLYGCGLSRYPEIMSATERHVPTACEAPKVHSATKRNYTTTGIIEVQTKCYFHTQLQDPTVSFQFLWSVVQETRTPFLPSPGTEPTRNLHVHTQGGQARDTNTLETGTVLYLLNNLLM